MLLLFIKKMGVAGTLWQEQPRPITVSPKQTSTSSFVQPFHFQEWSTSNFSYSLRRHKYYTMQYGELRFSLLTQVKDDWLPILTITLYSLLWFSSPRPRRQWFRMPTSMLGGFHVELESAMYRHSLGRRWVITMFLSLVLVHPRKPRGRSWAGQENWRERKMTTEGEGEKKKRETARPSFLPAPRSASGSPRMVLVRPESEPLPPMVETDALNWVKHSPQQSRGPFNLLHSLGHRTWLCTPPAREVPSVQKCSRWCQELE